MALDLEVLRGAGEEPVPADEAFHAWVTAALQGREAALVISVVDAGEGRRLNHDYRGKDRPTNVLSFPAELPDEVRDALPAPPLGDLVLCAPVVAREAAEQGKPVEHHWAHLVIHGVLHLLGHDHESELDAREMERLEVRLLADLGIPDPYEVVP